MGSLSLYKKSKIITTRLFLFRLTRLKINSFGNSSGLKPWGRVYRSAADAAARTVWSSSNVPETFDGIGPRLICVCHSLNELIGSMLF